MNNKDQPRTVDKDGNEVRVGDKIIVRDRYDSHLAIVTDIPGPKWPNMHKSGSLYARILGLDSDPHLFPPRLIAKVNEEEVSKQLKESGQSS